MLFSPNSLQNDRKTQTLRNSLKVHPIKQKNTQIKLSHISSVTLSILKARNFEFFGVFLARNLLFTSSLKIRILSLKIEVI